MTEPHPNLVASRIRQAASDRILACWYGYPPGDKAARFAAERFIMGRRIYTSAPWIYHGGEAQGPHGVPPSHDVGRERLRAILTGWHTPEWKDASQPDDETGGGARRALKAAGIALADAGQDGIERADALVLMASKCVGHPSVTAERIDRFITSLAALPKGHWRADLIGLRCLKEEPPVREI
ncbi:hypothetical protein FV219_00015 [Methylobacterium sp. WL122]|nr:hypothetical protein FV219_00015 [Methylobacterium sp. WL122]